MDKTVSLSHARIVAILHAFSGGPTMREMACAKDNVPISKCKESRRNQGERKGRIAAHIRCWVLGQVYSSLTR